MIKSELNPECGKRLKQCLEEKAKSQAELATDTGFTQQYISNIVVGKKPMTITSAKLFSKALGVREDYLLCKDDYKTWMDEERLSKQESSTKCNYVIDYLKTIGINIIPLIAYPEEFELSKDDLYTVYLKDNGEAATIVDKNGSLYKLVEAPWLLDSLYDNFRFAEEHCYFLGNTTFVAIEASNRKIILSSAEFPAFLKNIDNFVNFGINNFLDNYNYITDLYTHNI